MTLQDVIFELSQVYGEAIGRVAASRSALQSIAEDVEYEDVSESECEMIETGKDE